MIEKVNPSHPDKLADRIAGALVDLAYTKDENPIIAVEVMLGHGVCNIIAETNVYLYEAEVTAIVTRIVGNPCRVVLRQYAQDKHLADNQAGRMRCGDNGIFKGMPLTEEQEALSNFAHNMYAMYPYDGKFILHDGKYIVCQSNVNTEAMRELFPAMTINPLGDWTGGPDVDTGAVNRKLGSDMADSGDSGSVGATRSTDTCRNRITITFSPSSARKRASSAPSSSSGCSSRSRGADSTSRIGRRTSFRRCW